MWRKWKRIPKFSILLPQNICGWLSDGKQLFKDVLIFQHDSFYHFIAIKNIQWPIQSDFIVHIPPGLLGGIESFFRFI